MKQFSVYVSETAKESILEYIQHISNTYKMPATALRHHKELYERIFSLSSYAESVQVSDKQSILRYGVNARAIKYKKMMVVYTIHDTLVVVRALLPAATIK
jgi:hypothetical protein